MNVVFMGTPDFSVGTLEEIIKAGHTVSAVVTQPDKPKGRGGAVAMSPVKEVALKNGLTVLQPVKASNPEFVEELRGYNPDVIVVVAFGQLLPKAIIDMPKYGCINVHASLLPKYRGASPIQWAVIDDCEYSGVTTMQMNEGLDTGDILLVEKVKLDKKETAGSLFDKLSEVGAKLLVDTLKQKEAGTIKPVVQNDSEATYVKMINKSFGEIDFNLSAKRIECLIRGLNPWPSAYTHLNGKMLKIWDADVCEDEENSTDNAVGTVTKVNKNSFVVKCGDGSLIINEVQLEGKKRMDAGSFLRGNGLEVGTVLSSLNANN
jgi:methionyl-tRNA formyltransferase